MSKAKTPDPDTEPASAPEPPVASVPDLDDIPSATDAGAVGLGGGAEGEDTRPRYPLEKLEGIGLIFDRADFLDSSYGGDFAVISYRFADTGKEASTSTGSAAVKDRLRACNRFPFRGQFAQRTSGIGREYWTIID